MKTEQNLPQEKFRIIRACTVSDSIGFVAGMMPELTERYEVCDRFNAGKTIGRCLASLKNQTFTDYEVIVSDDGSADNTAEEVMRFKSANPELELALVSAENGGVSMARKRALERASGEWVAFLDADDTLPAGALASLYGLAGADTDLVVGFLTPPSRKIEEPDEPLKWQHAVVQGVIPPPLEESFTAGRCSARQCSMCRAI